MSEPTAKNSSVNFLGSTPATPLSQVSISRSSKVVVGEVKQSVSETIPAQRHIATLGAGISPRWKNFRPTSVQVEPTGSFR